MRIIKRRLWPQSTSVLSRFCTRHQKLAHDFKTCKRCKCSEIVLQHWGFFFFQSLDFWGDDSVSSYSPPDDTVSASSNMDMEDRVSHLEQKLQLQEDEIQLLKSALADALRRLGCCEEQTLGMQPGGTQAAGRRSAPAAASTPPTKGEPESR